MSPLLRFIHSIYICMFVLERKKERKKERRKERKEERKKERKKSFRLY